MSLEWVTEPISDDEPCGPDLNLAVDPEYDAYYFGALGRLPERFIKPGMERPDGSRSPDTVVEPKDIDFNAETKAIDALLKRSRDIRLLVLRAQWAILAGRILPMVDAVVAIADLLDTFGDQAHPGLADGPSERRDALSDLTQQGAVLLPIQFAGLTGTTEVTLRKLHVATGKATPLSFEDEIDETPLTSALASPSNAKKVDEIHSACLMLSQALARIGATCQMHDTYPFSPPLEPLQALVAEIEGVITTARADLRGKTPDPVASGVPEAPAAAPAPSMSAPATGDGPEVVSHAHARAVLEACEAYYRRAEPSSATLLLVTQARLLIGRPLIEALETLLPAEASKAVVEFGPQTGFMMNIDRLRSLSGEAAGAPEQETGSIPAVAEISDNGAALDAITSVESYFRMAEKSSPVPLLLQRARSYADKDFRALVSELIPQAAPSGSE